MTAGASAPGLVVVDYGVNNLRSVVRALAAGGHAAVLTDDPEVVRRAHHVLLPGVGHFRQAMANLAAGLGTAVQEVARAGRPVMGICLGLQLGFERSEEAPDVPGLALLRGRIRRFATALPVPHVGWARVSPTAAGLAHPVSRAVFADGPAFFYHVHSYHPADVPASDVLGEGDYDGPFATLVARDNVVGAQFHPEKSQQAGIALLDAFARWAP
ncbi:MAG: imidazole glycerol phosphate synthase subunit HisH [Gemmatimonadales bacterium]|nr:imidazole glycerol phosphate synthase subunit HisH [Gemmatimonadales bacterium]